MTTVKDRLITFKNNLITAKNNIATALTNKGVTAAGTEPLANFATKIGNIAPAGKNAVFFRFAYKATLTTTTSINATVGAWSVISLPDPGWTLSFEPQPVAIENGKIYFVHNDILYPAFVVMFNLPQIGASSSSTGNSYYINYLLNYGFLDSFNYSNSISSPIFRYYLSLYIAPNTQEISPISTGVNGFANGIDTAFSNGDPIDFDSSFFNASTTSTPITHYNNRLPTKGLTYMVNSSYKYFSWIYRGNPNNQYATCVAFINS